MTVLGIDTAADVCAAAIARDGRVIALSSASTPRAHAERLLAVIDECLRSAGLPGGTDAVAVASGPGSFTGLRIGFSTAKGLCLAWGRPLHAVPTFEAWAAAAGAAGALRGVPADGGVFIAAMTAGRDDAYVAVARRTAGAGFECGLPVVRPHAELPALAGAHPGAPVLCDRPDLAAAWFGAGVPVVPVPSGGVAGAVALRGAASAAAGEAVDLRASEPAYIKDFSATRKR